MRVGMVGSAGLFGCSGDGVEERDIDFGVGFELLLESQRIELDEGVQVLGGQGGLELGGQVVRVELSDVFWAKRSRSWA